MKSLQKYTIRALLASPQYIDLRPFNPVLRYRIISKIAKYTKSDPVYAVSKNHFMGLLYLKYNLPETTSSIPIRFATFTIKDSILTKQYHKLPGDVLYNFGIKCSKHKINHKRPDKYVVNIDGRILFKTAEGHKVLYINADARAKQILRELKEFGANQPLASLRMVPNDKTFKHPPNNTLVDLCIIALSRHPAHISFNLPEDLIYALQYSLTFYNIQPRKPLIFIRLDYLLTILTIEYPQYIDISGIGTHSTKIYARVGKNIYTRKVQLAKTLHTYKTNDMIYCSIFRSRDIWTLHKLVKNKSKLVANVIDMNIEYIHKGIEYGTLLSSHINISTLVGLEPSVDIIRLQKKYVNIGDIPVFSRIIDFPIKYM